MLHKVIAILLLALLLAPAVAEDRHAHHGEPPALVLDNGERWATDESLRIAMERLRAAVEQENLGAEALAARIGEEMQYMVTHCRLPAAADAELHKLLAMLGGAREKLLHEETRQAGRQEVHHVLELYGEYFAHEGWREQER